nr:hypothetical protein [Tanacetum cinerariifolium]
MFSLTWIMPPRVTTRSAGRPTVISQGGGIGGRAGRGCGRIGSRSGDQGNGRNDGQGGQVGDQGTGQGNGRNQNGDPINDNIQSDVRNVIKDNDRMGCTYKEFLACSTKEYDGEGGVVVYTRWIEKMKSVQDMSNCGDNRKVKYTTSSFVSMDLTCNEMHKLETELWNQMMVGAGHAAYTEGFHKLAGLVPHLVTLKTKGLRGTAFGFPRYQLTYLEKNLTMDEIVTKFIHESKQEHEDMETFIREFSTTKELLLKEQNNLLSELRIEVHKLSRVMNYVLLLRKEVKEITTKGGKMTSGVSYNKEINKANNDHNKPSGLQHDKRETSGEVVVENESPKAQEQIIQPTMEKQKPSVAFLNWLRKEKEEAQQRKIGDDQVTFDMEQSMKRPSAEDDESYNIDELDETSNKETQVLLENEQLDSLLVNNLEKTINQMDQENYNSIIEGFVNDVEVKKLIWCIDNINVAYSVGQKVEG